MKRWMSLLLATLLALSLGTTALAAEENPVGTVEGNVYTNTFLGFRMELPDTWRFMSDSELAAAMAYDDQYASREGLATLLESQSSVCAMFAAAKDNRTWNANLMMQDLGMYQYVDEQTYYGMAKDSLAGALEPQGFTDVQVTDTTFRLAGKEHVGAVLTGKRGNLEIYMIIVLMKGDKYMGSLTLSSPTQEQTEQVLSFFAPWGEVESVISTSEGQVYENRMLNVSVALDQSWYVLSEAERAQQAGLVGETMPSEELSKTVTDALEKGRSVCDLSAQRKDGSGDNVNMMLEKLGALGVLVGEKDYIEASKGQLEQYFKQLGCENVSITDETFTFCGQTRQGLFIEASINGQVFYERQVYIKAGSYMGILTIFSKDATHLDGMTAMFQPCV